ncbi:MULTISPECIES: glycosyltransferase [unclassified Acinetobacter]|uniref:glycosyltransferase n=1 Tax=unclassified Acinetobacter TaxID=196816 RepID=UPI0015D1CB8E
MIKVVHALGGTLQGGVFNMVFNFNKSLSKEVCFVYLVMKDNVKKDIIAEIEKNGGEVVILPNFRNFLSYIIFLYIFYKKNCKNIDVVHVHNPNIGLFDFVFARIFKIKIRVLHSHSDKFSRKYFNSLLNKCVNNLLNFFSTNRLACSKNAGLAKFKSQERFDILLNGIDLEKYRFSERERKDFKSNLNLHDKIIIGHVGAFISIKNHVFIIEVFRKLCLLSERYHLILVGDGELRHNIETKVKDYGLEGRVLFLGQRNDVEKILNIFDYFLFPSLFEGLGIGLIEAQALGVNCFASNNIPKETNITDLIVYLDLNVQTWVDAIITTQPVLLTNRPIYNKILQQTNFNVINSSKQLLMIYKGD